MTPVARDDEAMCGGLPERPVLVIDGNRFDDFAGFAREVTRLLAGHEWRGNLDALNDILRGGFGTPDGGWTLRWVDAERSRAALGYQETARRLEALLPVVHPGNRQLIHERLDRARRQVGPTLFDEVVEIVRSHGAGGDEATDDIVLELR
jgi:hypothetical protein